MVEGTQALNVGLRIKEARERKGLTQIALADAVGAKERTLQAWELGERVPRMRSLIGLANALEVTPAYFYSEPDEEAA